MGTWMKKYSTKRRSKGRRRRDGRFALLRIMDAAASLVACNTGPWLGYTHKAMRTARMAGMRRYLQA